MSYKTLQLDKDSRGVARLWLNRPDKHHAMNAQMISELHQAVLRGAEIRQCVPWSSAQTGQYSVQRGFNWMQEQQQKDKVAVSQKPEPV